MLSGILTGLMATFLYNNLSKIIRKLSNWRRSTAQYLTMGEIKTTNYERWN